MVGDGLLGEFLQLLADGMLGLVEADALVELAADDEEAGVEVAHDVGVNLGEELLLDHHAAVEA